VEPLLKRRPLALPIVFFTFPLCVRIAADLEAARPRIKSGRAAVPLKSQEQVFSSKEQSE